MVYLFYLVCSNNFIAVKENTFSALEDITEEYIRELFYGLKNINKIKLRIKIKLTNQ